MTWKEDLKREIEINNLDSGVFTLQKLFSLSYDNLSMKYPNNNTIEASIQRNLQYLRDDGYLVFLNRGEYKVINKENLCEEIKDENIIQSEEELDETDNEERIRRRVETPRVGIQINFILSKRQKGKCRNPKCYYKQIENFDWYNIPFENDHRKRVCDGGENDINNRQLLCPTCHKIKTINEQRLGELSNSEKADLLILQKPYEENEPI
jgi:5-methylcytosine-specific restriction endonuclease McrA